MLKQCDRFFEEIVMLWSATRILWDEQILLMWILLPPVFVASGLVACAAPILFREGKRSEVHRANAEPNRALAD